MVVVRKVATQFVDCDEAVVGPKHRSNKDPALVARIAATRTRTMTSPGSNATMMSASTEQHQCRHDHNGGRGLACGCASGMRHHTSPNDESQEKGAAAPENNAGASCHMVAPPTAPTTGRMASSPSFRQASSAGAIRQKP